MYMHLDEGWQKIQRQESMGKGMCLLSEVPLICCISKALILMYFNRSLAVGAGGTEDA